ncbi:MAG TPA: ABC transporter permease [Planctomycetota bacterium]|nr:ABC transporter permease [Planctomycetota bacterium]HRR81609.1 ABC transporter permease [Planctomycetota bacterium]HRT93082.1 ABC transporter permease [Planctomycetota bacterium]
MSIFLLILRSLGHYWRTHAGVVLGALVSTAVLVGALAVGDSVRYTLRATALARLGGIEAALDAGSRFFEERLATDVEKRLRTSPQERAMVAPVLRLRGVAANSDGTARANNVQVLGADSRFWALAGSEGEPGIIDAPVEAGSVKGGPADGLFLNERLAAQLGVREGDDVLLRMDNPSMLSRDAPLVPTEDATVAMRLAVAGIVSDAQGGRFGLQANQVAPHNAFVPLRLLQKRVGQAGRANLLLVGGAAGPTPPAAADAALKASCTLADLGLELRELPAQGVAELRTDRIFLDPATGAAAAKAFPNALGVLTYFVNELRIEGRWVPYSMVAALGPLSEAGAPPPFLPPDLSEKEVVLSDWLARDTQAKLGDELLVTYYAVGPNRKLVEQTARFRIRAVAPMEGLAGDRDLMPNYPGLADIDNCRDWRPGIPIDLKRIRKADEDYWAKHRGTPKAFISLAAGRKIWGNRFGDLTAIRIPAPPPRAQLERTLLASLDPADFGLAFRPVREEALRASTQALDFGQLFLGLSFFLIAAAVLLMGLLFVFGIEQRAEQVGLLLALGFTPRQVRRLMLAEGAILAVVGGVAGTFGGTLYTRGVVGALAGVWRGAVAGSAIRYHAATVTLLLGGCSGIVVAIAAMWLALRRQARRAPRELLAGAGVTLAAPKLKRRRLAPWLAAVAIAGALAIVAAMGARRDQAAAMGLFGAGALLLVGGLALSHAALAVRRTVSPAKRLGTLGWRNATRRRGRSLAVVGLLACASFLVFAVGANRKDPLADAARRSSGTGGFAFYGETALPVFEDLNTLEGRKAYGLDDAVMKGVSVVPLRVREGDDASCLNLNRAQAPRLLGVRSEDLQSRGAFTLLKWLPTRSDEDGWELLHVRLQDGVVAAIGDEATVTWGLGKGVGDMVEYTDGRGRPFRVLIAGIIANSILQGNLLIAEDEFIRLFPADEGYRAFLVDCPMPERPGQEIRKIAALRAAEPHARVISGLGHMDAVNAELSRCLEDVGLELMPAYRRLAEFGAVENTYLSIFQALGGLAMLLGSVGLGVVVLRNVMERRNELALLRAVGFRKRALVWLVLAEHWGLLALGLVAGTVSAVIAVLPALRSPGADVPYLSLGATLVVVAASGLLWTWLAAAAALRGPLLNALRNE